MKALSSLRSTWLLADVISNSVAIPIIPVVGGVLKRNEIHKNKNTPLSVVVKSNDVKNRMTYICILHLLQSSHI